MAETQSLTKQLFDKAIKCGFLSADETAKNYVGHFMFMGIQDYHACFKHYDKRACIKISIILLNEL